MSDSGSIVLGWLTKLVVLFAVLGVLAFDGVQLVVAHFGAADDATTAANAAADAFKQTHDVQKAYNAAVVALTNDKDSVETKTFSIAADGTVTLTVDRTPTTLWMHRFGAFKSWVAIHESGSASPAS